MRPYSKHLVTFLAFAVLGLGSAATAKADLVVTAGATGTGNNVLFGTANANNTTTLTATTNTGVPVTFTSTSNIMVVAGGQAAVTGGTGVTSFTNLSFSLNNGVPIATAVFNINTVNGTSTTATITARLLESNGTTITQTFNTGTLGNGQNFFTLTAINGESLLSATIQASQGLIDIRQIRIDAGTLPVTNTVPEPTTMLLLGTGLTGLAAGVRRRRNKQA